MGSAVECTVPAHSGDKVVPMVILTVGYGGEIMNSVLSVPAPNQINDVDTDYRDHVGIDPLIPGPYCDPNDKQHQVLRTFDLVKWFPRSARLKRNLKKVGCCPDVKFNAYRSGLTVGPRRGALPVFVMCHCRSLGFWDFVAQKL